MTSLIFVTWRSPRRLRIGRSSTQPVMMRVPSGTSTRAPTARDRDAVGQRVCERARAAARARQPRRGAWLPGRSECRPGRDMAAADWTRAHRSPSTDLRSEAATRGRLIDVLGDPAAARGPSSCLPRRPACARGCAAGTPDGTSGSASRRGSRTPGRAGARSDPSSCSSAFAANVPSATITFGAIASIWRNRNGSQVATSSGSGLRLPGGRHLITLAM